MTGEHRALLEDSNKIELTHSGRFELLCRYFSCNYETVNFCVSMVVLPRDTRQYSHNISANPWDLAEGRGQARGFSGTKDNKYVLPSPIKRETIPDLQYTDGKMLATLSDPHNSTYMAAPRQLMSWHEVLSCALFHDTDATVAVLTQSTPESLRPCEHSVLLDTGGCMAGPAVSNQQVDGPFSSLN